MTWALAAVLANEGSVPKGVLTTASAFGKTDLIQRLTVWASQMQQQTPCVIELQHLHLTCSPFPLPLNQPLLCCGALCAERWCQV